jgi:hypothetical protein
VEQSYSTEEGVYERLTDEILRQEIVESKERLEEMGLRIDNFVFPFGRHGDVAIEMVKEQYQGIANFDYHGLNPGSGIDPFGVGRTYYRKNELTQSELTDFLDTVAEEESVGMFAGHTYYKDLTEDRIRLAIREAKERGIEIVTLREALSDQGVLETSEEVNRSQTTHRSTKTPSTTPTRSPTLTRSPRKTPGTQTSESVRSTRSRNHFFSEVVSWLRALF